MKIDKLNIVNFRRFKSLDLSFDDRNLIVGINGSGKTTLLEAIYMLCWGKSFRTTKDNEVIRWEERSALLEGEFSGEDIYSLRLLLSSSGKRITLNGKAIARANLIGKIPVLFVSPEELSLLSGPPKVRRDFLNKLLSQLDNEYLTKYRLYLKLIKEKNSALSRGEKIGKILDFINERLFNVSFYIWKKREEVLNLLGGEEIKIVYKPSGLNVDLDRDALKRVMISLKDKEISRGFASFGPHLDEFDILRREGFSFRKFSSRGESKLIIWRFFMRALSLFKEKKPILLIDELFAELDSSKRSMVQEDLNGLRSQIFITALTPYVELKDFSLFEVRDGEVRRYNS